jgi:hypothetical protein
MLVAGSSYAFLGLFMCAEHPLFPEYVINRRDRTQIPTRYYMIDFRHTYRVNCSTKKIKASLLAAKCLQLTSQAREDLRNKIAYYFARVATEDKIPKAVLDVLSALG